MKVAGKPGRMRVGGVKHSPALPNRTGRSPASGFPVRGPDGLAQALVTGRSEATHQPRKPPGSAHLFPGGPLAPAKLAPDDSSSHRRAQPCGTTSALLSWVQPDGDHHVPTSLGSTVVTRFPATTDALTPAGPFLAAHRGSLIHVTRTSGHSVSNHLRCSTRRVPLPQRWPPYFVRASPFSSRLASTADRIEFTRLCLSRHCYGLVVRFPLLSTRGYRPDAVTFSYWPFSVGQVRDSHPAVLMRSQAHWNGSRCEQSRRADRRGWVDGASLTTT